MKVRVTGVLIEDDQILLLDQDTDTGRSWSLPGGTVELGEPLGDALVREMHEETGVEVRVGRLLYVCDHLPGGDTHVVHMTFEAARTGGTVGDTAVGADTMPIRGVKFVPLADLPTLGFSPRFVELAQAGWPGAAPLDPDRPGADIRIGYARCSSLSQELQSQLDALAL